MVHSTFVLLALAATAFAKPMPLTPDPAGEKNIGNGQGIQFIGGACLGAADCASTCCATLNGAGICSGIGAQFQAGKQGCGFEAGGAAAPPPPPAAEAPPPPAAEAPAAAAPAGVDLSLPGSQNVGKGDGSQFITGQCFSDADCASGCCAKPKGFCSGPAVAFDAGKQGCGFTSGVQVIPIPQPSPTNIEIIPISTGTATAAAAGAVPVTLNESAPGSQNVGKGNGAQFITGQCISDADCASGCCAKPKGVCSAPLVAFDNGKQGCGFSGSL